MEDSPLAKLNQTLSDIAELSMAAGEAYSVCERIAQRASQPVQSVTQEFSRLLFNRASGRPMGTPEHLSLLRDDSGGERKSLAAEKLGQRARSSLPRKQYTRQNRYVFRWKGGIQKLFDKKEVWPKAELIGALADVVDPGRSIKQERRGRAASVLRKEINAGRLTIDASDNMRRAKR